VGAGAFARAFFIALQRLKADHSGASCDMPEGISSYKPEGKI
jgi:hypothetical protein